MDKVLTQIAFCVVTRVMEINYISFHCAPWFSVCQSSYLLLLWSQEIEFHFWLTAWLFLFVLLTVPDHSQRNHAASSEGGVQWLCSFLLPFLSPRQYHFIFLFLLFFTAMSLWIHLFIFVLCFVISKIVKEWLRMQTEEVKFLFLNTVFPYVFPYYVILF